LLQRTRAEQVVPVYERFAERYPEPKFLAREKPAEFLGVIASLGLRWRAPLMIQMAQKIEGSGSPPENLEALTALPGVGPYAASAFLSLHRGKRAVIVDANVVRWLGRVFGFATDAETRRKAWLIRLADELTPRRRFRDYNYAVLDLAMKICVARPRCDDCPLSRGLCKYASARAKAGSADCSQLSRKTRRAK
jgi:A/G-specific adenine glycosylase